jgi:hypothetical protein
LKREDINLLKRKLIFLESFHGPKIQSREKSKMLFNKVREMIESNEITTMLGVESTIQYCIERMNDSEESPEVLAEGMKNFVN